MSVLFRIELPYAVGGIVVANGIVIHAARIFKWTIRKKLTLVRRWVTGKGGSIIEVPSPGGASTEGDET